MRRAEALRRPSAQIIPFKVLQQARAERVQDLQRKREMVAQLEINESYCVAMRAKLLKEIAIEEIAICGRSQ